MPTSTEVQRHDPETKQPANGRRSSTVIRAELEAAEGRIDRYVRSMRSELTLRDVNVGHSPILDYVRWYPFRSVGITLGLGAAVALTLSLVRRKPEEVDVREQWLRAMIADLLDDAAARIGPGRDGDAALRQALRKRQPVILIDSPDALKKSGSPSLLRIAAKASLGFVAKSLLNHFTAQISKQADTFSPSNAAGSETTMA